MKSVETPCNKPGLPAVLLLVAIPHAAQARTDAFWLNPVSGTWSTGANWSTGAAPNNGSPAGTTYNVIIDAVGANYTVTDSTTSIIVNSILVNSANARLNVQAGTLKALAGITINAGSFTLSASTLDAAKLSQTTVTSTGGTMSLGYGALFDAVTLDADATVVGNGSLTIQNTLTVVPGRTLTVNSPASGSATSVRFLGAGQTLNSATIVFDGNPDDTGINFNTSGAAFTLGPAATIRTGAAGGTIGNSSVAFTNQGTISAESAGRKLTVRGLNWQNQGLLKASGGGTLVLEGTIPPGGLGNISVTGGAIALNGTLTNTGTTTLLDGPDKILRLTYNSLGGKVIGGTLATANGGQLLVGSSVPQLTEVTLDADLDLPGGRAIQATNSLSLSAAGSIRMLGSSTDGTATLSFVSAGANTLGGSGEITFGGTPGGTTAAYNVISTPGGSTLTIAPGVTIRTDTDGGIVGSLGATLVNQGTILATVPGRAVAIRGNTWRNEGLIHLDGGQLKLQGTMAPGGLGTVTGSGSADILLDTGAVFDNTGQEIELGGDSPIRLRLRGAFQGGTVLLNDNEPPALNASPRIGTSPSAQNTCFRTDKDDNCNIIQVAVVGTSPSARPGASASSARGTVPDVHIDDRAAMYLTSSGSVTVRQGLTLGDVTIVLDGLQQSGGLNFDGNQTLSAAEGRIIGGGTTGIPRGTILIMGGSTPQSIRLASGTLTIGNGIAIVTGDGTAQIVPGGSAGLINNGLISARTAGQKIEFYGSASNAIVNGPLGIIEAKDGGTIRIGATAAMGPAFSSVGTLRAGSNGLFTPLTGLTMSAAGKTAIEFAGRATGQFGKFTVTGNTVLAGTLECQLGAGFAPVWGDVWTVLTSTGTVTGAFATVTGDAIPNPSLRWWSDISGSTARVGVRHFADLNHDGAVNTNDLTAFLGQFGSTGTSLSGDFNSDGAVNTLDLTQFLGSFGLSAS